LIWPRPSLAAARQAALDLARRWGQSKRRQSSILFVDDHPSHLRANDQAALHAAVDSNTAAVVLGASCAALTTEYCQAAANLCRDLHILLVIDSRADHPPLVKETTWGIKADIVIVDHDRSHGFLQPAFVVRTHTDGLEALARFRR
jgi:acetylornithine/succinyldiaminopimelate/putrescine aminotransferase